MIILVVCLMTTASSFARQINSGIDEKIVGGFPIDITRVPYQVSIQTTWKAHYCGGSLISSNMVLTAAHCVAGNTIPQDVVIYLGSSDRTKRGFAIKAKSIKYHEDYKTKPTKNDIALIRLSRSLHFTKKIRPIKLAVSEPPPGTTALATGWGKLNETDPDTNMPHKLQGVYLKTISLTTCRAAYGSTTIQNTNICAYTEGKDTCQGDSGGPLAVNGTLVGIVSWGSGCARRGAPGVYASVVKYSSWIYKNIPTM